MPTQTIADQAVLDEEVKKELKDYFTGTETFENDWESLMQAHGNLHTNDHTDHNASASQ